MLALNSGPWWKKLLALIIIGTLSIATLAAYFGSTGLLVVWRVSKRVHITSTDGYQHFGNPLVQADSRNGRGSFVGDARPGNQSENGLSVNSSTGMALWSAIRAPVNQTVKKEQRWTILGRNAYVWDDKVRESRPELPQRGEDDRDWKREDALVFNRVPKCGSRTVIRLLRELARVNNFSLLCGKSPQSLIEEKWQRYIVETLDQVKTPYLFQKHLRFIDFTKFDARQPMYINIIRDPLSRFLSHYYFRRFGDANKKLYFKGTEEQKNMSVTECILHSDECLENGHLVWLVIRYFCGQRDACSQPSQWALERAKQNVEKHFVVVGILEDLENSFRVLEKVLPRYFTGMVKLFNDPALNSKNPSFVTKNKEKPSAEAAAIMKRRMHYEYEFYDFVKDRLERQKAQYGIK